MRRWDSLVESYLAQGQARGLSPETLEARRSELDRVGCWLKRRRPKPNLVLRANKGTDAVRLTFTQASEVYLH